MLYINHDAKHQQIEIIKASEVKLTILYHWKGNLKTMKVNSSNDYITFKQILFVSVNISVL